MDKKLHSILGQVIAIQSALLRFRHRDGRENLQVKVAFNDDDSLHCVITGSLPSGIRMKGKRVHLIQKYHDDYFFIAGIVSKEVNGMSRVLSIEIHKAAWFVRRKNGSVTWMREKSTYEKRELENMRIAS